MNEELRKLQLVQLEILQVIDAFCRKHKIHYSLYAGTLLGAVRHRGFIPWDDDLDICMTRSEYNRFIKLWLQDGPEGYLIQNKELEPAFTQSFTKIRKDHTAFLQYEFERGRHHTGIFVDIFPIDRTPVNRIQRTIYLADVMLYQLYTREFVPPEAGWLTKAVAAFFLRIHGKDSRQHLRGYHFQRIVRYNRRKNLPMAAVETLRTAGQPLLPDLMSAYTMLPFEGGSYMCMKRWDAYLEDKFGDYMQLPPPEEREWKHHPIVLDFERSLEELQ